MMATDGILDIMKSNWSKYVPRILQEYKSESSSPLEALKLLDKQFRNGPTHKLPGAFQIYEVNLY